MNCKPFPRWTVVVLALACGLLVPSGASAGSFPQWGNLKPGPYSVGFKVVHTYDYSRAYRPRVNHAGQRADGETARPMQVAIWYPAEAPAAAPRMKFGEYVDLRATDLGLRPLTDEARRASSRTMRGPLSPFLPQATFDAEFQRVMETPTAVVRDAPPAKGLFPVVINGTISASAQSVMLEYLASHGYVVAMVPLIGSSFAHYDRGEGGLIGPLTQADDLGFVYGFLRDFPSADRTNVAAIGAMPHAGVLFQMKSMQLTALVSIEGDFDKELATVPGFNPAALRIPILDMVSKDASQGTDFLDTIRHSDRYIVRFRDVTHANTYPFQRIAQPERAGEHVAYEVLSRYTLSFLDAVLKKDLAAKAFLDRKPEENGIPGGYMTLRKMPGLSPVPTEAEFLTLIRQPGGVAEAVRVFRQVKSREPSYRIFSETALSFAARFRFFADRNIDALELYKIVIENYPASASAQQNIGDAYMAVGQKENAMKAFDASLQLIAGDPSIPGDAKAGMRTDIQQKLARLRGGTN